MMEWIGLYSANRYRSSKKNKEISTMSITMADLKPSILTALLFALYALAVIPLLKYFLGLYEVPGLSALAAAI